MAYADASTHLPALMEKRQLDEAATAPGLEVLATLQRTVHPVPEDVYEPHRAEAVSRIEVRDPDDWPILATALALDCPIWTEDQDFFGAGVPTWTTDRVEIYLNSPDRPA